MHTMNVSLGSPVGPVGYCSPYYGRFTNVRDCINAIKLMDQGTDPINYTINQGEGRYALPFSRESGSCIVQIEGAGPALPTEVEIAPSVFRTMADWVLENCLNTQSGSPGGWFTTDLTPLRDYITRDGVDLDNPYPTSTGFFAVTLSNPVPDWLSPGNWDPEMAFSLRDTALAASKRVPDGSPAQIDLVARAGRFFDQATDMEPRGRRINWWARPPGRRRITFPTGWRPTFRPVLPPAKPVNRATDTGSMSATARRKRSVG